MTHRSNQVMGAVVALAGTLLTLWMHHVLYEPTRPVSPEYALSGLLLGNYSWGVAAILGVLGLVVGFVHRTHPVAAGAGLILVAAGATLYEIQRFPTSHNLLPFDVVSWVVMAAPLMLGALAGSWLRERTSPLPAAGDGRAERLR